MRVSETSILKPILISGGGRSGTTLLMELLGSSPVIAFERTHPYERRYLTYLFRMSKLLTSGEGVDRWTQADVPDLSRSAMKAWPWPAIPMLGDSDEQFWRDGLIALWSAFSSSVIAEQLKTQGAEAPVAYAEKTPPWLYAELKPVMECVSIIPLRDPRDVFLSAHAVAKRRKVPAFGIQPDASPLDAAVGFVNNQHERLRIALLAQETGSAIVVRYEDLISDLESQTERLGDTLGISLSSTGIFENRNKRHSTVADLTDSVSRWKREMSPDVQKVFSDALGGNLESLGYDG